MISVGLLGLTPIHSIHFQPFTIHCRIQELLGHSGVRSTMIYTHNIKSLTVKKEKSPLNFLRPSKNGPAPLGIPLWAILAPFFQNVCELVHTLDDFFIFLFPPFQGQILNLTRLAEHEGERTCGLPPITDFRMALSEFSS